MLNGFADALKIKAGVLSLPEPSASFPVEPLQTILNLVMSMFVGIKVLKEEKIWMWWNLVVSHGVESLHKEGRDAGTARHSFKKELLLEFVEADG